MANNLTTGWRESAFLSSALAEGARMATSESLEWLAARASKNSYRVTPMPISELSDWAVDPGTGNLSHASGRFFSVEGLEVATDFGPCPRWAQPIVSQPETGVVGFLTQEIEGALHFLVQAKMEPGNVNLVQISPTVQATQSNYTQVHGGSRTPYVDYFLGSGRATIMVDQLQSEQGSRFFRKRNRNMIVQLPAADRIDVLDNFCWLTLRQLNELIELGNVINMDSRSVLSCVRFVPFESNRTAFPSDADASFAEAVFDSAVACDAQAVNDFDTVTSWFAQMRASYHLTADLVPLRRVRHWIYDGESIRHTSGRRFSVIGVDVVAEDREVGSWQQPLVQSAEVATCAFVSQKRHGTLHFLVQALVEPGNLDIVEIAPTLHCTPSDVDGEEPSDRPPFFDLVMSAPAGQVRYDQLQSEEGGRFYHEQNRYLVIEIDEGLDLPLPPNYLWLTLRQLKDLTRFNNLVNIEARTLMACLPIKAVDQSR